jgi:hypothetical protein
MDGHVAHRVQIRNAYGILVGLNHTEHPAAADWMIILPSYFYY